MDPVDQWKYILVRKRKRKQLPLDIEHSSPITLRNIILDGNTPSSVLDRIAQIYSDDEYLLKDLVRCPNLDETTLAFIALTASDEIRSFISGTRVLDLVVVDEPVTAVAVPGTGKPKEAPGRKKFNVIQAVQKMTNPQKIKLALSGGKEARSLLIRESNKQVSTAVLENPRITDGEIEFFAKSANLGEDIMRKIGTNSDWTKKYTVAQALVYNPKCPPGVAVGFVTRMTEKDLAMLEKSRNVSEAVRSAARGLLARKKAGKK
ncbi:MAG: hypothetical protein HGB21_11860 [Nitrospirae bacterium]|nr:hypothetical protein [Nitrospirota bacterium]NTW66980.1 hypothetical protein [Nitrospirota bacterium]